MKNKTVFIILGLAVVAIAVIVFVQIKSLNPARETLPVQPILNTKLQQCPDEWINNRMPSTNPQKPQMQYYIVNGERRELNEFDTEWIQKNCNLRMQDVF